MTLWEELLPLTARLHGRVLDVGCGYGHYSTALSTLPNVVRVVGVDGRTFPEWNMPVLDRCARFGLKVEHEPAPLQFVQRQLNNKRWWLGLGEFDCCMAWQIIEHVSDKRAVQLLRDLRGIVSDTLFVAMPMGDVWARRVGVALTDSPDAKRYDVHHSCWTPEQSTKRLASAGWRVTETYFDGSNCQNYLAVAAGKKAGND